MPAWAWLVWAEISMPLLSNPAEKNLIRAGGKDCIQGEEYLTPIPNRNSGTLVLGHKKAPGLGRGRL